MKTINLTIDGKEVRALEGETLVDAAKRVHIDIPNLCYMRDLDIVSSCRLCVVEIEGWGGVSTACSTFVQEGMVVHTETDELIAMRRDLLQLLLDNHPNDCLTCQSAGECELQKYSYRYGVDFRDHDGQLRGQEKAEFTDTSSPYILRDESKCILCERCIRSCGQVPTRRVLSFSERGFDTRVIADADESLEESSCVSCYRCVAVCPVGALIDRRAYKKVRPMNASIQQVKCTSCDYGCNMEVLRNPRTGKAESVRAVNPFGSTPLCLKGKLRTEAQFLENPDTPYKKIEVDGKNEFLETTWLEALELDGIYDVLKKEDQE